MFERLVTAPALEVVTVEELANFVRQDVPEATTGSPPAPSVDYTEKELMITAARDFVEQLTKQAMITQRWLLAYDTFPDVDRAQWYMYDPIYSLPPFWYLHPAKHSIELLRRPAQESAGSPPDPGYSDVVVTYYDQTGVLQTLDPTTYIVFANKITLLPGNHWPNAARMDNAVRIEYSIGYGETVDAVPARLISAVKFLAGHYWENRAIVAVETTSEIYMTLTNILYGYKLYRVAR